MKPREVYLRRRLPFGAFAPHKVLQQKFCFTVDNVVKMAHETMTRAKREPFP